MQTLKNKTPASITERKEKRRSLAGSLSNIDKNIGRMIKLARTMAIPPLNQLNIGDVIGVSLQQIQKYEDGKNRIAASKLKLISDVLNVPISFFFRQDAISSIINQTSARGELGYIHNQFQDQNYGNFYHQTPMSLAEERQVYMPEMPRPVNQTTYNQSESSKISNDEKMRLVKKLIELGTNESINLAAKLLKD